MKDVDFVRKNLNQNDYVMIIIMAGFDTMCELHREDVRQLPLDKMSKGSTTPPPTTAFLRAKHESRGKRNRIVGRGRQRTDSRALSSQRNAK